MSIVPEARPGERDAEQRDDGGADRAADRRRRRLDDLERGRQERELVAGAAARRCAERDLVLRRFAAHGEPSADFMEACLQAVERGVAAAAS